MVTVKKAPKVKKPASKEALNQEMKEITFEKKFNILAKELSGPAYERKVFPKGSTITISGELFQDILNERHEHEQFVTYLHSLLRGSSENIEKTVASKAPMTYRLMSEFKKAVDQGVTVSLPAAPEADKKVITETGRLEARYKRRIDSLLELGFLRVEDDFTLDGKSISAEEVYQLGEQQMISRIAECTSEPKPKMEIVK